MLDSKVTVWYMTEEERLAYIKKHPIIPTEQPKGSSYLNVQDIQYHKHRQKLIRGEKNE